MDLRLTDLSVEEFLRRLATDDPVPGGGSASALAGAMAAALVNMVAELTTGRPAAADHEGRLAEIRVAAAGLQSELLSLAQADAAAYAAVVAARRLPKETDRDRETRQVQLDAAIREAIRVPLSIAQRAAGVLALAEEVALIGNRNAVSDAGVAGLLAGAAVRGAALNVEINLPSVRDGEPLRAEARRGVDEVVAGLEARGQALAAAVGARIG